MSVAQGLYEGVKVEGKGTVGLITYMRTDSTRISEEARAAAKTEIVKQYGRKILRKIDIIKQSKHLKMHTRVLDQHIFDLNPEEIKDSLTKDPI